MADKGNYIGVQFYDDEKLFVRAMHPTYEIVYLETFGKPKKVKNSKSKQRYQDYLNLDSDITFAQYLGIRKKSKI